MERALQSQSIRIIEPTEITKYDSNGNKIYYEDFVLRLCESYKYDNAGNMIYYKDDNGDEESYEYNDNVIHCKKSDDSGSYDIWYQCNSDGNIIYGIDSYDDEE